MAVDLEAFERCVDEALAKETTKSLRVWFFGMRMRRTRNPFKKLYYKIKLYFAERMPDEPTNDPL